MENKDRFAVARKKAISRHAEDAIERIRAQDFSGKPSDSPTRSAPATVAQTVQFASLPPLSD